MLLMLYSLRHVPEQDPEKSNTYMTWAGAISNKQKTMPPMYLTHKTLLTLVHIKLA